MKMKELKKLLSLYGLEVVLINGEYNIKLEVSDNLFNTKCRDLNTLEKLILVANLQDIIFYLKD